MSIVTRLVRDDAYQQMGGSYQCVLIAALDEALRENGIADASVRKEICGHFIFGVGNLHDQGWFKTGNEPIFPILCFCKKFLNIDTDIDELGIVYAPSKHFAYHEYAFGDVDAYYDDDPTAQIETGSFGELGDNDSSVN